MSILPSPLKMAARLRSIREAGDPLEVCEQAADVIDLLLNGAFIRSRRAISGKLPGAYTDEELERDFAPWWQSGDTEGLSPRECRLLETIVDRNLQLAKSVITCAFCGHQYESESNDPEQLRLHVMECEKHPMRAMTEALNELETEIISQVRRVSTDLATGSEGASHLLRKLADYAIEQRGRACSAERERVRIKVFQQDWMPGAAAYQAGTVSEDAAHVLLNLGSFMVGVQSKQIEPDELPYFVAECLMHEVVHVLEDWAGVEFTEERVEQLIAKYRDQRFDGNCPWVVPTEGMPKEEYERILAELDEQADAIADRKREIAQMMAAGEA